MVCVLSFSLTKLTIVETGLLVFTILDGVITRQNCHLEVLIDDNVFPSYSSSKTKAGHHEFDESM
jgi:hypothetical protein